MLLARSTASKRLYSHVPLIIQGKRITSDPTYDVYSATGDFLHKASSLSPTNIQQINDTCEKSQEAFKQWASTPSQAKVEIYDKILLNFQNNQNELIKAHLDIGVAKWFAEFNVFGSIDMIKHYKSLLSTLFEGKIPIQTAHPELSMVVKQPIGPVLSISPWNAPGILSTRSIAAPLSAGCSVIHKSSELSPLISYLVVENFIRNTGLPENTINLINTQQQDSKAVVESFIANKFIRKINFTGSTKTGSEIASTAGKYVKPILLELGGKNCTIIKSDTSDLTKAITTSLWSSWCHKGQICMCTDLIYIDESIYDESVELVSKIANGMISNDQDLSIEQRDLKHIEKVDDLVHDAVEKGAKLVVGSLNHSSPKVLTDVDESMRIYHEEIFGPVVLIKTFNSSNTLIKEINSLDFGLKCSIWTNNHLEFYKMAREIDSGSVHLNAPTVFDEPHLPHGGFNKSGYGKFNSYWGIKEFQQEKLITFSQ